MKLWLAQGFGIGRIPVAPGTFGSILGLAWFALLLAMGRWWVLLAGSLLGFAASVWLCGVGERLLKTKDPGSVVMDEVTAIPVCFLAWVGICYGNSKALPSLGYFADHWVGVVSVFGAFRFFDVTKPWPVRQSQSLPGGWGITADDFLAALYVNLMVVLVYGARALANR